MSRNSMDSLNSGASLEISPIATNFYSDNAMRTSLGTVSDRRTGGVVDGKLTVDNPYPTGTGAAPGPAPDKTLPFINSTIAGQIKGAKALEFTSPQDNVGTKPDYRLSVGTDGKLRLEKVGKGDPHSDGKLNIEMDPKNKSLQEAIKNADKNLKEYCREMMTLWKREHPNEQAPGWWQGVLNSQPDIPQDAAPVPITNDQSAEPAPQDIPTPQDSPPPAPNQSSGGDSSAGGGTSGGGGGASGGGGGASGGGGGDSSAGGGGGGTGGGGDGGGGGSYGGDSGAGGGTSAGGSDRSGASGGGNLGPDVNLNSQAPVAMQIMDYFVEKGLTPAQAAGIVGNMERESRLDPTALEGGSGPGFGLVQWSFGRRDALDQFAASEGKQPGDLKVQLDFLWKEMNTTESATLADFKAHPDMNAAQAAQAFCNDFERPGVVAMSDRTSAAEQFAQLYASGDGKNGAPAVASNNPAFSQTVATRYVGNDHQDNSTRVASRADDNKQNTNVEDNKRNPHVASSDTTRNTAAKTG